MSKVLISHNLLTPLWTIPSRKRKYQTVKPIKIRIYAENDVFFAENETLVVIGTGKSLAEAIDDLSNHIVHFYHYYRKLPVTKITGDAIRLKKIYETLFIER